MKIPIDNSHGKEAAGHLKITLEDVHGNVEIKISCKEDTLQENNYKQLGDRIADKFNHLQVLTVQHLPGRQLPLAQNEQQSSQRYLK